ncbi:MAG: (d)CMP kinase [Chloroflexi bacterium]|nr:(d)CMP kinase [Chloroflexota bacterium]
MTRIKIAIDGPAASGKSTIGCILAEKLGYLYLDTGVMYRAVTWAALDRGVPIEDEEAVTRLAETVTIEVIPATVEDGRQYSILANGRDITWEIRSPDVNRYVSPVSAYQGVRRAMTQQQRRIARDGGVVMVGRDIGTVVLPDAEVKLYLDASLEERSQRRYLEYQQRGQCVTIDEVRENVMLRDRIDSTRDTAPLRPAEDAIVIDTTSMSITEVVERTEAIVRAAIAAAEKRD